LLIQGDSERYGVLEVDSPTEGGVTAADIAFLSSQVSNERGFFGEVVWMDQFVVR